jgi:hypothetical protein
MLPKVSPSKTASIWVFLIQGKKSWTLLLILSNKNKVHSVINICNIIIWNLSSKIFLCMKTKVNVKIEQHVPDDEKQRLMQLHRRDTPLLSNYDTRSINARAICVLVPTPLLPSPISRRYPGSTLTHIIIVFLFLVRLYFA